MEVKRERKMAQATERFTVSHEGMRLLQAGRPAWELTKELIQNAWDEAPEATVCNVTIQPQAISNRTQVTVEDDGPGFDNITDAYTLMANTAKRADPKKRGRFNLGEKEFISIAHSAKVETAGFTVTFPESGGRKVTPNKRKRGTKITADMPWTQDEAYDLVQRLWIFRPRDCALIVNTNPVPQRQPITTANANMETVLQDHPGAPMRRSRRNTDIELLPRISAEESWLYEMGIPIQTIDTPCDIDVLQKVPLPPNRTEIPTRYLANLYAVVLNAYHPYMNQFHFGEAWVKTALNDPKATAEAVKATIEGRYGKRVLITGNNADSNLEATESGYLLINPRSLSENERKRFRSDGELATTNEAFPQEDISNPQPADPNEERENFAQWVVQMGNLCNLNVTVEFIDNPNFKRQADCTPDNPNPTVRFNVAQLEDRFFKPPYARADQLELVIHEFGHAVAQLGLKHGPRWGRGVAKAGALIATNLR